MPTETMDPQLLDYHNRELAYMRELAGEFARQHPEVVKCLGMYDIEVADPYMKHLIEASYLLSVCTQIKLGAEFPRFAQRLLEAVYPNYVAPTPAIAVAQFHLSRTEGDLVCGVPISRDMALLAKAPPGESTEYEFRTTQPLTLWPIEIVEARLAGIPPDIQGLERYVPVQVSVRGAPRLRLWFTHDVRFSQLAGLDRLPIRLSGNDQIASYLFELLHSAGYATLISKPGAMGERPSAVMDNAVGHIGMAPDKSALPLVWNKFHGHNLVHEYLAYPQRPYFFGLNRLVRRLSKNDGCKAEIVVLLSKAPNALASQVDASQFVLFCTPVINLFPMRTDRMEASPGRTEFHPVADWRCPFDFEVFSAQKLSGRVNEHSTSIDFRLLLVMLSSDEDNYDRYFSAWRGPRLFSDQARKYGIRTAYMGTEVFLSLVDQNGAPYSNDLRYLSVEVMMTSRDLPNLVSRNGFSDLSSPASIPVEGVGLIRPPSAPHAPFAEGEMAWRLIRQLGFNYLSLIDLDHRQGGQGLCDMLWLFVSASDIVQQQQIESLIGPKFKPVTRRMPGAGPILYGRGVQCHLTVDEAGFSGASPYLFGVMSERFLTCHVSANAFTETELHAMERGLIHRWSPRMGGCNVTQLCLTVETILGLRPHPCGTPTVTMLICNPGS